MKSLYNTNRFEKLKITEKTFLNLFRTCVFCNKGCLPSNRIFQNQDNNYFQNCYNIPNFDAKFFRSLPWNKTFFLKN